MWGKGIKPGRTTDMLKAKQEMQRESFFGKVGH